MIPWRRTLHRLRNFARPAMAERELAREVSAHLGIIQDDFEHRGLSPAAARLAARRSFGGVEQAKERHRDERSFPWLEDLRRDVGYALRALARNRGFTVVAVLTIALGIGATSAIFSLINAVLLRPLPAADPRQLVLISTEIGGGRVDDNFSYPFYETLRERTRAFSGVLAGGSITNVVLIDPAATGGERETITAERVSGNYFQVLGVNAAVGRMLTTNDDRSGQARPVVVISDGFWTRVFNRDPSVVGRNISLDDVMFRIVGVAPPGFSGIKVGERPDLWWSMYALQLTKPVGTKTSSGAEILTMSRAAWLTLFGRLAPGATLQQANAEAAALFDDDVARRDQQPGSEGRLIARDGSTGSTPLREQFGAQLTILSITVGIVLLIACANVANLLLARNGVRQAEFATRLALGASRGRMLRQLVTESLVLAGAAGLAGLALAGWGARLMLAHVPQDGVALDVAVDRRVLAFTAVASIITGLLFGMLPAWRASRPDLMADLKIRSGAGTASGRRMTLNRVLVIAQVSLTVFLLIGTGLFMRTLGNLRGLDAGFNPRNLTMFLLNAGTGWQRAERVAAFQQILQRLTALPGVSAASLSNYGLLRSDSWATRYDVPGRPGESVRTLGQEGGPHFFETMGTPIVRGRDFTPADITTGPRTVMVINETMAQQFFGSEDPLGRLFRTGPETEAEVVGVAKDAKYRSLREAAAPTFAVPFPRADRASATFEVRTSGPRPDLAGTIRTIVREIDPRLQIVWFRTMDQVVDESLAQELFVARLAMFFSALALLLAAVGIYGVLSYNVSRRSRELAIRLSLGAPRDHVTWMVLRGDVVLLALGFLIGIPAALVAGRFVRTLLFGVDTFDPASATFAAIVMAATGLVASYIPTRRAVRADPLGALRAE